MGTTTDDEKTSQVWTCPRCGRRIVIHVTATEVRCSCGRRCKRETVTREEAKRIVKEAK